MVLDNNIITTYSGRKALLYLQRGDYLKRHWFTWIHLDSSESTKWNCLASLWNPCILNVHKIINLYTKLSYIYKPRFNLLLMSLALKKLRAARTWPTKFRRWEELGFKCTFILGRTSTDMKSSSLCGSERKNFAQLRLLWFSAVNTSAIVCFEIC